MDHKPQRRHSVSVQSATPSSSLRHCLNSTSPGTTSQSHLGPVLRHSPRTKTKLDRPPQPAAFARVKGTRTMETPSRTSTEMSWLNDPSPMNSSPRTIQTCRSRTPDASSNTSLVTPSSSLLQDLLNEQRATRGSRTTMPENPEDNQSLQTPNTRSRSQSHSKSQIQTQSQSQDDTSSERQRKAQIALSAGLKNPREMGMREMDHYISKINKQNFDLKLEIFHRAQQMTLLEKKLERMMEMEEELHRMHGLEDELQELRDAEEDNLRLRESNEQLRHEIDKRDQAVTEAVALICQLEAKVEQLEIGGGLSQPSTPRAAPNDSPATTPRNTVFDIPERTSSRRGTLLPEHYLRSSASRHLKRAPSFLREENKNTAVLRSLYVPAEEPHRPVASELTTSESYNSMNGTVEPESPRLSALSECSELHPSESTRNSLGFDELDIPTRKVSTTEQTDLSFPETESIRVDCWVQPRPADVYALDIPKARERPTLDTLKAAEKTSFESGSLYNSSSARTQVDSVFGSARLPPTPDTMSTAHAPGSNGSNTAERSHLDELLAVKRSLRRPRSADELTTTRRSSGNSQVNDSLDPNASETTFRRTSFEDTDEPPVLYPLNSLPYRSSPLPHHGPYHNSHPDYSEGDVFLNGGGMDRVLSKMDKDYYSPRKHAAADLTPSSSPPLSPQEWVEAARASSRSRKAQPLSSKVPVPKDTRLVGARAPSQSSFLGRRHSIDSTIRDNDVPNIPTLDLRSLEPMPQAEPDHDRPRKLSLKPLFFSRSTGPRRPTQSPTIDSDEKDDGAPAPTIRKTRQLGNARPGRLNQGTETANPGGTVDFSASAPTYAEGRGEDVAYKTLPHSLTESNFAPSTMPKGFSASNPKDHKRRSSLGIFGWMKGGSKKTADPDPYVLPIPPAPSTMREKSARLAQDIPTTIPESKESDMAAMNIAVEDFARRMALSEESPPRRPRYVDRRSRRG